MEEKQTLQQFVDKAKNIFKSDLTDALYLEGEHLEQFENEILSLKEFEGVEKINFVSSDEFNRDYQEMIEEKGELEPIILKDGARPSHTLEQYVTVEANLIDEQPLFDSKKINLYQITIIPSNITSDQQNQWRILIRLKLNE